MLTAMRRSDTAKVTARDSERTEAPFQCPTCQREVTLHKGQIKVHHFAHKPPVTCARGIGESEAHLQAKLAIFDALKREGNVADLEIERDCGISVADICPHLWYTSGDRNSTQRAECQSNKRADPKLPSTGYRGALDCASKPRPRNFKIQSKCMGEMVPCNLLWACLLLGSRASFKSSSL